MQWFQSRLAWKFDIWRWMSSLGWSPADKSFAFFYGEREVSWHRLSAVSLRDRMIHDDKPYSRVSFNDKWMWSVFCWLLVASGRIWKSSAIQRSGRIELRLLAAASNAHERYSHVFGLYSVGLWQSFGHLSLLLACSLLLPCYTVTYLVNSECSLRPVCQCILWVTCDERLNIHKFQTRTFPFASPTGAHRRSERMLQGNASV